MNRLALSPRAAIPRCALLPILLGVLLIPGSAVAQLSGTYTIDSSGPDAGRNYASFTSAVNALNTLGVSGAVTFDVASGTFSEQITIGSISGSSAANTVTFQSATGTAADVTLEYAGTSIFDNFVVDLNASAYVTFQNMTFKAAGTGTYGSIAELDGASNITFSGCIFQGLVTTSIVDNDLLDIRDGSSTITVTGNTFNDGAYQVSTIGTTTAVTSVTITNNTLNDPYNQGIHIFRENQDVTINNNTVSGGQRGISVDAQSSSLTNVQVTGNTLTNQTGKGIVVSGGVEDVAITGNTVKNSSSTSSYTGIYLRSISGDVAVTGNTVTLDQGDGMIIRTNVGTAAQPILVANNFVYSAGGDGAYVHFGNEYLNLYHNTFVADNRALYISGLSDLHVNVINNLLIGDGSPAYAYQVNNSSAIDASDYNDLYTTGSTVAQWNGTNYASLSALQAASSQDANSVSKAVTFVDKTAGNLHLAGSSNGDAALGGTPLTSVGTDIDGDTRDTTAPYMGADEGSSLTTGPMCGTYTVDASGSGFKNYASFGAAATALDTRGVKCAVTFEAATGTYTEQVDLPEIAGASTVNTVTFESASGNASDVTVEFGATGAGDNFVVRFNGTDYTTLKNMTLTSTSAAPFGRVVFLDSNADFNTVTGCTLNGRSTSSTSVDLAVVVGNGTNDDNALIENNTINDGSYGVYLRGFSPAVRSQGTVIAGNTITNPEEGGILLQYQQGADVRENTIRASTSPSFVGIAARDGQDGLMLQKNDIGTANGTGIDINNWQATSVDNGEIYNNMVRVDGTSGDGVRISNSQYQKLFFNTVSMSGTGTRALAVLGSGSSNIDVKNNVLSHGGGGYAYYVEFVSNIRRSDYNDLYSSSAPLGYWSGTNCSTLGDWQAATSIDTNSSSKAVTFVSSTDLHLDGGSIGDADLIGTPIGLVPDDIDGDTRDAVMPYMGADESGTALPVELVSFDAVADGRDIRLTWTTASETNNAGFEVQWKMEIEKWEMVRFVEGHGTTLEPQRYTYRLADMEPGRYRFRLKQIDFDGTFEYSPEAEVIVEMPGRYHLSPAYPNPFNQTTQFMLGVVRNQRVRIAAYDVAGRRVAVLYDGMMEAGAVRPVVWHADGLPTGLYMIRVGGEIFAETRRVVLIR
ncbi:MAG: right-handed parallel beta-helix repeat-containing protein [Rhodothermales bacterium]